MRLIDADALKELIASNVYPVADYFNSRDYGMFWTGGIEKAIDEMPSIDAVKHGRWVVDPEGMLHCSNCKELPTNRIVVNADLIYDMTPIKEKMKYCPNCGAIMDERKES